MFEDDQGTIAAEMSRLRDRNLRVMRRRPSAALNTPSTLASPMTSGAPPSSVRR